MSEAAQRALMDELVDRGLLIPCGVPGVYGRGGDFERLVRKLDGAISALVADERPELVHFPPLLPTRILERSEYLESFPHLCGAVYSFTGSEAQHRELVERIKRGERWEDLLRMSEVVLTPAACYPLYPTCRGSLPAGGRLVDLTSYCFRHEPSPDPARMQMFRMRELVRLGSAAAVQPWRERWIERSEAFLRELGLDVRIVPASDPFFGRAGRMLAANQRDQGLKHEIVVPITSNDHPTAVMSFNYHQAHFGALFDIHTSEADVAHTSCLGFGIERIVIALLKAHGMDPGHWPASVRDRLSP